MRYLGIIDSLGAGGAERSNTDLWHYLREQGVTIKIVFFNKSEHGTEKEIYESNFDVEILRGEGVLNHTRQLKKIIEDFKPDIVHSTLFKSNLRTRLAKIGGGKFLHIESLVNTTYDHKRLNDPNVELYKMEGYRLLDALTMWLFTDHLHSITNEVSKHYQQKLFVDPNKITVIPRGRNVNSHIGDLENRNHYRKEVFEVPDDCVLFISVGRKEFQKGHIYMIDALQQLRDVHGIHNFRWLLLGRDGHASKSIDDRIQKHDLDEFIIQAGHRYDVQKILPAADVYVFPSLYEGLGGALLEAQAAGLPLICSDIPVLHETTTPENSLYVDPLHTEAFASALLELSLNEEKRIKMGRKSFENFSNGLQLEQVHARMMTYFQSFTDQTENAL